MLSLFEQLIPVDLSRERIIVVIIMLNAINKNAAKNLLSH